MNIDDKQLAAILVKGNYVSEEEIKKATTGNSEDEIDLVGYLLSNKILSKDLIGQAVAESFGVSYADLNSTVPVPGQVQKIPEDIAKKYKVVVISEDNDQIVVATDNPENNELPQELGKIFLGKNIGVCYALTEDIEASFVHYQKPLETRFSKIIEGNGRVAPEFLEEIFDDALLYTASDIHFEPRHKEVVVRFRVDGVLHVAGKIPKEFYENILNRIKVQSGLRIDEHFSTQDGSLQYAKKNIVTDFRTSIVPTVEGEKVVLRILPSYVHGFALSNLGLSTTQQELLDAVARKPFGMIIVVGPTGSGKTTTLYAPLKRVNRQDVNITTIEDPVEYKIDGINQIQTNMQTGLTFAKGLRSIVRQDPDIVLVGEIRDKETAEISVNAALTDHLLYSTFHANDAATAIPRLLDMGIEPFLLASTLQIIVAQRLIRKTCEHCKHSVVKTAKDFETRQLKVVERYFGGESVTLYEGQGCDVCGHTGYKGRTAIYEFIRVTGEMQGLMLKKPSAQEVWQLAREQGAKSIFEDGIEKVKGGLTTIDELLRVAEPASLDRSE